MDGRRAIELRVHRVEDLRTWWLDGFPQGGLFIPGVMNLAAGAEIVVRIRTEEPAATTLLAATVVWRRHPTRHGQGQGPKGSGAFLRAGVGVAFEPSMRARVLFIERLERRASRDARRGFRYPSALPGLLYLRPEERPVPVRVDDVGTHGARIRPPEGVPIPSGGAVRLWVGDDDGAEITKSSFAPLPARVVWSSDGARVSAGLRLDLGTKEDRLHWARVVHLVRTSFEQSVVPIDRRAG